MDTTTASPEVPLEPKKGEGALSKLDAQASSIAPCQMCQDPNLIPIYPVRVSLADIYGEMGTRATLPNNIQGFTNNPSLEGRNGYTLRMLREGYVYIYDESNDVWSIFQYSPGSHVTGGQERFAKIQWSEGSANGPWKTVSAEEGLRACYVSKTADHIWVGFSEHRWSGATFSQAHTNVEFRNSLMQAINVLNPQDPWCAPFSALPQLVEDYSLEGLTHNTDDWNLFSATTIKLRSPNPLIDATQHTLKPGIAVGVFDVIGVMEDIEAIHAYHQALLDQYMLSHAYPITVGHAIEGITLTGHADAEAKFQALDEKSRKKIIEYREAAAKPLSNMRRDLYSDKTAHTKKITNIITLWETLYQQDAQQTPPRTPGGLRTWLQSFDPHTQHPNELYRFQIAVSQSLANLAASEEGQKALRRAVAAKDQWDKPNPVKAVLDITKTLLGASKTQLDKMSNRPQPINNILANLSIPASLEALELQHTQVRHSLIEIVETYTARPIALQGHPHDSLLSAIYGHPIRPGQAASGLLVERNIQLRARTDTVNVFTFTGEVNVPAVGVAGNRVITQAVNTGAFGFATVMNVFNMHQILKGNEKLEGKTGRLANNTYLTLSLGIIEALSTSADLRAILRPSATSTTHRVTATLTERSSQIIQGMSQRFYNTPLQLSQASAVSVGSSVSRLQMLSTGLGIFAGITGSVLGFMRAAEASNRGDTASQWGEIVGGIGGISIVISGVIGSTTGAAALQLYMGASVAAIGAATSWLFGMGIVLILSGIAIVYFFADDAVERWIKNSFWGLESTNYLYWDDADREEIRDKYPQATDLYDAQRLYFLEKTAADSPEREQHLSYQAREMQDLYNMLYQPRADRHHKPVHTQHTTHGLIDHRVRFRFILPGFVNGLSELKGSPKLKWTHYSSASLGINSAYNTYQAIDEPAFKASFSLINADQGLVEASVTYREEKTPWLTQVLAPSTQKLTGVEITKDWLYSPRHNIQTPVYYGDDYLIDSEGGKRPCTLVTL